METLFNAVDLTDLTQSLVVVLTALVGVAMLFFGYRYLSKALGGHSSAGLESNQDWKGYAS